MDVDAVLNHVVGWDALSLVFQVGLAGVGQVEGGIQLGGGHRRVGRVDDNTSGERREVRGEGLDEPVGVHHVRLFLYMSEVLGLRALVAETLFMAIEDNVVGSGGDAGGEVDGLRDVADVGNGNAVRQLTGQFEGGLFAHAVGNHVGP